MKGKKLASNRSVSTSIPTFIHEQGGALVELVFLVPLLLLIIAGLTEMGMVIGQATWVSESAYQTTLVGGESQRFLGNKSMEAKYSKLYSLQASRFKDTKPSVIPTYDINNRTVRFEANGQLRPILMNAALSDWLNTNLSLNLGIYYVGSHMAQSPGALLNGLASFGNSASGKYCDCLEVCDFSSPNLIPCQTFTSRGMMPAPREVGGEPNLTGGRVLDLGGGGGGGGVDDFPIQRERLYH